MVLYTGAGGAELFDEAMDRHAGYERVYAGKKPLRLLKHKLIKSPYTGRYYRRFRIAGHTVPEFKTSDEQLKSVSGKKYADITLESIENALKEVFYGQKKIHP